MKPTIEKPKVFISYAWGSQEYQNKVLSFARDLVGVGIDVLLDKWDLKEGNDTYAYMEKCVNDKTVTNVIVLLDPNYEEKANNRTGGVGTETQIISPEIYNKVNQEKFLPVIFQKKQDGSIPKPHFLKGILHFDLSDEKVYYKEYQILVKRLYGIYIFQKPELGNTPRWVMEEDEASLPLLAKLESIRNRNNPIVQKDELMELLDQLCDSIISYESKDDDGLEIYKELQLFRNDYLQILKLSHGITESNQLIYDFIENICSKCMSYDIKQSDEKLTLIHEMFIYTVAFYYKHKDYDALSGLLCKTYFIDNQNRSYKGHGIQNFYNYSEELAFAKSNKDDKKYHNGIANIFVESLDSSFCSLKEFCFADELCYNYTCWGNKTPTTSKPLEKSRGFVICMDTFQM